MTSLNGRRLMSVIVLVMLLAGACRVLGQTLDPDTKFRLAQGLERAGELERAAAMYKELYLQNETNPVVFDALQRVLVQLKQYDDAITILRRRLAINPQDINLLGLLGNVYYKAGREEEANKEWENILAVQPKNAALYRVVANLLIENRLLDRAADVYRRGRGAVGDQNLYALELGQVLVATMEYAGATKEYLHWLDQNPAQLAFVENRMTSFTAKPEGRRIAIDAVREALQQNDEPRRYELLGWLYLEGNEFEKAFDAYRVLDKLSGRHGQAVYEFAERAQKAGAFEVAARAYQEAIDAPLPTPRLPFARFGYATTLRDLGLRSDSLHGPFTEVDSNGRGSNPELDKAINSYRAIIRDYPHTEFSARSWYEIGDLQAGRFFDLNSALSSLTSASTELPGSPFLRQQIQLKTGSLWLVKGDTAKAAEQYRTVASNPTATPDQTDEASFKLAQLDYFAGTFTQATQRLKAIALNLKADYANDALELQAFLAENMAAPPEALKDYARAELMAQQRHNSEAVKMFQHVLDAFPTAPLADDAMMNIAALQAKSGKLTEAVETYEKLMTQFKESGTLLDRAQFRIGEIYQFGLHNTTKAITAYETLLADFPRSIYLDEARKRIRLLRGEAL